MGSDQTNMPKEGDKQPDLASASGSDSQHLLNAFLDQKITTKGDSIEKQIAASDQKTNSAAERLFTLAVQASELDLVKRMADGTLKT